MALLITTLAITIVANLFWQQQVQVRAIDNQRLQLQKKWILRGALDWASLILREDAKHSSVDTLDEPWAVPLAETHLDQYVENGQSDSDAADTTLSGNITDAQGRFNLKNLCPNGTIDPVAVAAFASLLTLLHIDPALAPATAYQLKLAGASMPLLPHQPLGAAAASSVQNAVIATTNSGPQNMGYTQIEDLLTVPGLTAALLEQLRPYVIFLPRSTTLNINTAPAEVISAIVGISLDSANVLVTSRKAASFNNLADVSKRLPNNTFNAANLSVTSNYFLIDGQVHMNRARLDMQALIERNGATTQLLWIREF